MKNKIKYILTAFLLINYSFGFCQFFKDQDSCKFRLNDWEEVHTSSDTCTIFYVDKNYYKQGKIKGFTTWSSSSNDKPSGFYYPSLLTSNFKERIGFLTDSLLKKNNLWISDDYHILDFRTFNLKIQLRDVKVTVINNYESEFNYQYNIKYTVSNNLNTILATLIIPVKTGFVSQSRFSKKNTKEEAELKLNKYLDSLLISSIKQFTSASYIKKIELSADSLEKSRTSVPPIYLAIQNKVTGSDISNYVNSVVTLKFKEGYGSGCIVSSDGYVVSTYQLVKDDSTMEVIFNDGTKSSAEIIRMHPEANLALLKIKNAKDLKPMELKSTEQYKMGNEIFAIGSATDVNLGQSISKGIISAFRKSKKREMIQMDIKTNLGCNGGALLNKNGEFIGIINSKLLGMYTEGISFSIPAYRALSALNIKYAP